MCFTQLELSIVKIQTVESKNLQIYIAGGTTHGAELF